ncbi:hypothetical protein UFOVP257_27 [uncultured Caudovirales phage]|uniref:Uncharacterized protein n=1 Tax=uncultured Caudovirales phage TaxID=2100421 RepID=A0A6J5LFV0_9CAUD|nr:hypothetical protein UFOVP257_27 [uncultured Caudovirales phage]
MATTNSVKAPKKAPAKKRDPLFSDEKHTGREPVWDTERAKIMSQEDFDHFLRKSFYYYNYYYTQKDCKKYVVKWMQDNGYNKQDVSKFIRSPDRAMPMTACSLVMAVKQGMPMREKELEYLKSQIAGILVSEEVEPEETSDNTDIPKITIQDRLNEKTSSQIGEIEGYFDDVYLNIKTDFKPYDYLASQNVPQAQLSKFESVFAARRAELELAQSKKDEQVTEGYKNLKAADFKRIFAWLDELLGAIDQYRGVKKATKKLRVKRAPTKEKLVSKLKYLKEDSVLKVVSINPSDIIGAQELWCYNVKTRKLFKYVADAITGPLNIKGTSITGFDAAKSIGKTLRKPEEKLKEFTKAGKVALRTFLSDIKATETLANGRMNEDTVLLRVA